MKIPKLTNWACPPHKSSVIGAGRAGTVLMAMLGSGLAAGCISVNAPSEPIVIELNINITQEVIYRLAADAGNTIDENADIF
jgi:H+/gluconate symporter-like permease